MSFSSSLGREAARNEERISLSFLSAKSPGQKSLRARKESKSSVDMTMVRGMETYMSLYFFPIPAAFISMATKARPLPFPPREPLPILVKRKVSS